MNRKNGGTRLLIFLEILVLLLVILYGIVKLILPDTGTASKSKGAASDRDTEIEQVSTELNSTDASQESDTSFSESVVAKLESMTDEEKVAQLFLTRPEEITGVTQFTAAGDKTKEALSQYPLGGFVFDQPNFGGVAATQIMMANIQNYIDERIGIGMFLAVNEDSAGNTPLATANALTVSDNPSDVAAYISDNGLNMNLAAFGLGNEDTLSVLSAYRDSQVDAVAGIFPGEAVEDLSELQSIYGAVADAGLTGVMLGTYTCQALTGSSQIPCIMSADAVAYLRQDLDFDGIIMTADLAQGISGDIAPAQASVDAINAGVDMIYVSTGFADCYQAVLDAVNSDQISQDTLDNAVGTILTVKGI